MRQGCRTVSSNLLARGLDSYCGVKMPLESEADWWAFRHRDAEALLTMAAGGVVRSQTLGRLTQFNLRHDLLLADLTRSGVPPRTDSLFDTLRAIPLAILCNGTFNALASSHHAFSRFPHVQVHFGMYHPITRIAGSLIDWAFDIDPDRDELLLKAPQDVVPPPTDSSIVRTILGYFDVIASKEAFYDTAIDAAFRDATGQPLVDQGIDLAETGAKLMVLLHEVGHHVLGHLHGRSAGIEEEDEADAFAAICLAGLADDPLAIAFMLAGAEIPFILMSAIPEFREGATHSPPLERAFRVRDLRMKECRGICNVMDYALIPLYMCALSRRGLDVVGFEKTYVKEIIDNLDNAGLFIVP